MEKRILISPSILAANYAQLADDIRAADHAGADAFHWDIMDGHFVPNISFGPDVMAALRPITDKPFDVHLMVEHPDQYVNQFIKAGANGITFHVEWGGDREALIKKIHDHNIAVGIAFNPHTPLSALSDSHWAKIDRAVIMTVKPGFGGQKFMPLTDKISEAVQRAGAQNNAHIDIQIDGGITPETVPIATKAGGTNLVAGSAIFKADDIATAIHNLRHTAVKQYGGAS